MEVKPAEGHRWISSSWVYWCEAAPFLLAERLTCRWRYSPRGHFCFTLELTQYLLDGRTSRPLERTCGRTCGSSSTAQAGKKRAPASGREAEARCSRNTDNRVCRRRIDTALSLRLARCPPDSTICVATQRPLAGALLFPRVFPGFLAAKIVR